MKEPKSFVCFWCGYWERHGSPDANRRGIAEHIKTCVDHPVYEVQSRLRAVEEAHHKQNARQAARVVELQKQRDESFAVLRVLRSRCPMHCARNIACDMCKRIDALLSEST